MSDTLQAILSAVLLVLVIHSYFERKLQAATIAKLSAHLDTFTKETTDAITELNTSVLRTRMGVAIHDNDLDTYRRQTMDDEIHMMKSGRGSDRSSLRSG